MFLVTCRRKDVRKPQDKQRKRDNREDKQFSLESLKDAGMVMNNNLDKIQLWISSIRFHCVLAVSLSSCIFFRGYFCCLSCEYKRTLLRPF